MEKDKRKDWSTLEGISWYYDTAKSDYFCGIMMPSYWLISSVLEYLQGSRVAVV